MTARTRHYGRHDSFLTAEAATEVLCDTKPKQGNTLWATDKDEEVTCKRCLKIIAEVHEAHTEAQGAVLAEEAERFLSLVADGPKDEYPAFSEQVTIDLSDRGIAQRHGLERFEVENAINDGWLKR